MARLWCCLWRADEWVLKGISGYIYGLYLKKTFGVNEYRHWIKEVSLSSYPDAMHIVLTMLLKNVKKNIVVLLNRSWIRSWTTSWRWEEFCCTRPSVEAKRKTSNTMTVEFESRCKGLMFEVSVMTKQCFSFQSNSPPPLLYQAPPHSVLGVLQDVPVQGPPGDEADREQDQHGVHAAGPSSLHMFSLSLTQSENGFSQRRLLKG